MARLYDNLFTRLVANTHAPTSELGCWPWKAKKDRWGYGRLNVYVPGLARRVIVQAHLAMLVCVEASPANADEFWLAYLELRHSGLELDHTCVVPSCIHPDHHDPVTPKQNCQRREERARLRVFPFA